MTRPETKIGEDGMQVLRTPDERFAGLADWPFAPHYRGVIFDDLARRTR
jgi:hypothetical protein